MAITVSPTPLPGVLLVAPKVFGDARGFFFESYNARDFVAAGMNATFVQDNHSRSQAGTVRGLHYQLRPGQAKLVRVVLGEIYDVVLDLRPGSPTRGQWYGVTLSAANQFQLFVPVGFAHGFCAVSEVAEVIYKVDTYYDPAKERGVRFDDPSLAIPWPTATPILSPKDRILPTWRDAEVDF